MASTSSKAIPFVVMGIILSVTAFEVVYDAQIDIAALAAVLAPMGVAGAAKDAIEKAGAVRAAIPDNIKNIIRKELDDALPNRNPV